MPQLRQRVRDGEVIEYDSPAVMTPVMTVEEGFRRMVRQRCRVHRLQRAATPKIVAARETSPAPLIVDGEHFICASCLPWLHFTSMTHAEYAVGAAVPALTGETAERRDPGGRAFNHAFVDGLHASRFLPSSKGFRDPERFWQPLTATALTASPTAKDR